MSFLPPIPPPRRRAADLVLHVEETSTGHGRGQFVSVAHQLYRGDRRWIPSFRSARRDALRPKRNPLLRNASLGAFLGVARNLGLGDETVGVLAAWSVPADAHDELGVWGAWGLFEALNVEELADKLFYEAETWLFEHTPGMMGIRGPCGLEPLVPPGLLTDGFDAEPLAFLPYNLPYYPEIIEGQGYEPGPTWRVYSLDLSAYADHSASVTAVSKAEWERIRHAYASHYEAARDEVLVIPALVQWLDRLAGNAPFSWNRSWQRMVGRAFRRAIAVVHGGDGGAAVAACFGIPDVAPALRLSRGRELPFGWLLFEIGLRRARRLHVFSAAAPRGWAPERLSHLYAVVAQRAAAAGFQQIAIAPVPDDDERGQEVMSRLGARPVQQFTVCEKAF